MQEKEKEYQLYYPTYKLGGGKSNPTLPVDTGPVDQYHCLQQQNGVMTGDEHDDKGAL